MSRGNWGIQEAHTIREVSKNGSNSVVRIRTIKTLDGQLFIDVRNWYNRRGEVGYPNMGKGIWIPADNASEAVEGVLEAISTTFGKVSE